MEWRNRQLHEMVATIRRTRDVLKRQRDLSPRNETVNTSLSSLVRYVTLPHNKARSKRALDILDENGVAADVRNICQRAEYQLELYYSNPELILNFPYVDHYIHLAHIESRMARLNRHSKVVFIGGGPLPWTPLSLAIIQAAYDRNLHAELELCLDESRADSKQQVTALLKRQYWRNWKSGFQVLSVEREPQAARQARVALQKLGVDKHVQVATGDGAHMVVPEGFDTFFIASMVEDKECVLLNIMAQVKPGQEVTFLVRSVEPENLRALLYQPVDRVLELMERCVPGFRWVETFIPEPGSRLINSVHVYRYRRPAS